MFCLLDGEVSIFNPNCRTDILLDDIKRRCNCNKDGNTLVKSLQQLYKWIFFNFTFNCSVTWNQYLFIFSATVDLSDESGNLKYLVNHPLRYATELLKERESFVLIRVESKFIYAVRSNVIIFPPVVSTELFTLALNICKNLNAIAMSFG